MMVPTIGALRHRLQLETPLEVSDGAGGTTMSWQDAGPVWGAIQPMAGRELLNAGRVAGRLTHEITLRYRSDILPNMRLTYAGRVFEIHAVMNHDERRRWLICHCEELGL